MSPNKQHPYRIRPESEFRTQNGTTYSAFGVRSNPLHSPAHYALYPNSDTHTHTNFIQIHPFFNEHVRICLCGSAACSGARFPVRYVPFLSERGQGGAVNTRCICTSFETFPYVLYTTCRRASVEAATRLSDRATINRSCGTALNIWADNSLLVHCLYHHLW